MSITSFSNEIKLVDSNIPLMIKKCTMMSAMSLQGLNKT